MTGPCPQGCGRHITYATGCRPCTTKAKAAAAFVAVAALALFAVLP